MNKQQWHEARRRRHALLLRLWSSESPIAREIVKHPCVPANPAERARNLRWRHLARAIGNPGERQFALGAFRALRRVPA
jgi:hypothetical protein